MANRPSNEFELELMGYLEKKDLNNFKRLLKCKNKEGNPLVDANHIYGDPYYNTCLGKAAILKENFEESAEFIKTLLENNADPNIRCETRDFFPIHFAAERNNLPALKVLLQHPSTDPNILNSRGRTALYLTAHNLPSTEKCFKFLATHPKISTQHDLSKLTAIGIAAKKRCKKEIIEEVIKHVDYLTTEDKKLIQENYPDIEIPEIPDEISAKATTAQLYSLIDSKNVTSFKEKMEKELVNTTATLPMTFLQLACQKGLTDIVEFLIDLEVNINATGKDEPRPPVHLACFYGHSRILDILIKNHARVTIVKQKTLLHAVLEGHCSKHHIESQHRECFDYLLKQNDKLKIPINHGDEFEHTALHYAVLEEDHYYTKELLKHGAYIGSVNNFGISPLQDIEPDVLESILDGCIQRVEGDKKSNIYTLKVDFSILKPPYNNFYSKTSNENSTANTQEIRNGESTPLKDLESGASNEQELPEMYPLFCISQSKKLCHLLKHPVFLIFLSLKWNRIRMLFYLNLLFYTSFVIFLTAYILCSNCDDCGSTIPICHSEGTGIVRIILLFLSVVLVLRELMQFALLPDKYSFFSNLENWLELGIIATTIIVLCGYCTKFLASLTLILAWTEAILQFGCIYELAIYNEMMKRVTFNYFKFLCWYSPLIVAFTFSFYKLYHRDGHAEEHDKVATAHNSSGNILTEDEDVDFYSDFSLSFVKTIVMMIGEFDASGMNFNDGGKVIFIIFVFMITIVLLNLLNGLAVSDTQAIKNDAELVTQRSRVKLVHSFERVAFGGPLQGKESCVFLRKYILNSVTLFPEAFTKDNCLIIKLKHNKKIGTYVDPSNKSDEKEFRPDQCCSIGKWRFGFYLDQSILEEAKDIADKDSVETDSAVKQIEQLTREIRDIKTDIANLKELLQTLHQQ